MSEFQNSDFLKSSQYAKSDNLSARILLHQLYSTSDEDIHRWMFDHVLAQVAARVAADDRETPLRVLEVGAGRCDLWFKNAGRIPQNWEITLSDFSEGMLADGKAHLGEIADRFSYEVVDVQQIPYPDAHFDLVIANYMLYHVPDLPQAIRELRRVLKPSGVLFALTNGDLHMHDLSVLVAKSGLAFAGTSERIAGTFTTQTGESRLSAAFGEITYTPFESDLHITQAEPLIGYVASMLQDVEQALASPAGQMLQAQIAQQLADDGMIVIRKETGLFIAHGAAS